MIFRLLHKILRGIARLRRKIASIYWAHNFKSCGRPYPRIDYTVEIGHPDRVCCGKNVSIQHGCYIAAKGGVTIGDDVHMSRYVRLLSQSLYMEPDGRVSEHHVKKPIVLGNNVWLGTGVIVLPGVTIGDNTIVGAGAVVTKNLEGGKVYAGIPAHPVAKKEG